ncbi:MAG: DUF2254 domain-containing protein [Gemmatimonadota bacterium]
MKVRLLNLWDQIQSSYWLIPSLMALGAAVLAFTTTALDARLGSAWMENIPWLQANQPDGARALLSTVAASMIGVAGVTFSITMVAMVMASAQFGPRLLSNFMRDRGNQTTLGIFIATFIYCLLVLRTVKSPEVSAVGTADASFFVPHLAVLVGLALAVVSLGAFIFFIHHAPESIHISNVIADVGRSFGERIDHLYPGAVGEAGGSAKSEELAATGFDAEAACIEANGTGYIQAMDPSTLLDVATDEDLFLRVAYRPGDFVSEGKALVYASPASRVDDGVRRRIRGAFVWGRERTRAMDILYLSDQLVEIAARALSPGVNDPHSAMDCLDWLGAGLIRLGERPAPDSVRVDDEGTPRVLTLPVDFEVAMDAVFDPLRPYVSSDRNATARAFKVLAELASSLAAKDRAEPIALHADALMTAVRLNQSDPRDLAQAEEMHRVVTRLLNGELAPDERATRLRWLGGSG